MPLPLLAIGAGIVGAGAVGGAVGKGLTGQRYSPKKYDINGNAFDDPRSAARDEELFGRQNAIEGRQSPQAQAAQRTALERANGGNLGNAAQANGAMVNRGEDRQARMGQVMLTQQLQEQAAGRGPSLAEGQLRAATDRNIKQQMAVASAQGGNPALAMRDARLGAAEANRGASQDAAQMRIQEQIAARQQLAGVLSDTRQQDIGVNSTDAGFAQQAGLANMDARNQFAMQQAQMRQQNNQFNASAANQMYAGNFDAQQATNLANMQAEIQTMGLNDEQARAFMQMRLSAREADRQAAMERERMLAGQSMGHNQLAYNAHEAQTARTQNLWNSIAGGAGQTGGAVATMGKPPPATTSDPASKTGVQSASSGVAASNKAESAKIREGFAKDEQARQVADAEKQKKFADKLAETPDAFKPVTANQMQLGPVDLGGGRSRSFGEFLAMYGGGRR